MSGAAVSVLLSRAGFAVRSRQAGPGRGGLPGERRHLRVAGQISDQKRPPTFPSAQPLGAEARLGCQTTTERRSADPPERIGTLWSLEREIHAGKAETVAQRAKLPGRGSPGGESGLRTGENPRSERSAAPRTYPSVTPFTEPPSLRGPAWREPTAKPRDRASHPPSPDSPASRLRPARHPASPAESHPAGRSEAAHPSPTGSAPTPARRARAPASRSPPGGAAPRGRGAPPGTRRHSR
jgi:hypothetical protein